MLKLAQRKEGQPSFGSQTSELRASQGPQLPAATGSSSIRHLISMHNKVF